MSGQIRRLFLFLCLTFVNPSINNACAQEKEGVASKLRKYISSIQKRHGKTLRLGLSVVDTESGQLVFEHQGGRPLIPASVMKIVTSVAALKLLGSDYRFPTEIFVDRSNAERLSANSRKGNAGNLYFRGYGDPGLVDESLWKMVQAVKNQGIKEVNDVVIDDSLFISPNGPQGPRPYQSGLSATVLNHNSYAINVVPTINGQQAEVHLSPGAPLGLINRVTTRPGKTAKVVLNQSPESAQYESRAARGTPTELGVPKVRLVVKGSIGVNSGVRTYYHSVPHPPAYLAGALRAMLTESGVNVLGKHYLSETPGSAKLLQVFESRSLGHLLADLNQYSNNVIAGQLLYALGQDDVGYFRTPLAIKRVEAFLRRLGIPDEEFEVHDGSGLDRANRLSARALTQVLRDAYQDFAIAADLISSLSRYSKTGTLKKRVLVTDKIKAGKLSDKQRSKLLEKMWGKTGTLNGVSSLAGYLETSSSRRLAYAIILNGDARSAKKIENTIITLLIGA